MSLHPLLLHVLLLAAALLREPLPVVEAQPQELERLESWAAVRAAMRVPLGPRRPFIVSAALTEQWPLLREWDTVGKLSDRFGDVEAMVARGRALEGNDDETSHHSVAEALDLVFGDRMMPGRTTSTATQTAPAGARAGARAGAPDAAADPADPADPELKPSYVVFPLGSAHWARMRELMSPGGLPSGFDDERFLDCLGPTLSALFVRTFFWHQVVVSQEGSGMHLHVDGDRSHFWALQLSGTKHWRFCPPEEGEFLFSFSPRGGGGKVKKVDAFRPNLVDFPDFPRTEKRCFSARLRKGEFLYWHSNWWHQTTVPEGGPEEGGNNGPSVQLMSAFIDTDIFQVRILFPSYVYQLLVDINHAHDDRQAYASRAVVEPMPHEL